MKVVGSIKHIINKGSKRSVLAKKNVLVSLFLKGGNVFLGLLLVPIVLQYLGQEKYGIWLTIGSIVQWMSFFDIGLGHGLRNKFAKSIAIGNKEDAKIYVSTAYGMITIIMAIFILGLVVINPFIDWVKVLNTSHEFSKELTSVTFIVFGFFSLNFILKLITTILVADQKPALRDFILFIGKIFILSIIFILNRFTSTASIELIAITFSGIPVLALLGASLYFYKNDYKEFVPSFKYFKIGYTKSLLSLGGSFFLLQISSIILITTDNIIISQLFGPKEVVPYQIAHKYFGIIIMIFTILISPLWSAITDAYHRNDIEWIKRAINKLIKIWVGFVVFTIIMLGISNFIYKIWVGPEIIIPFHLSLFFAFYSLLRTFNSIFTSFLNGVGKIRLSLVSAIFTITMNIPLSIYFAKYLNMGISGVILATSMTAILNGILRPIQYHKIIYYKATGIWNK